MSRFLRSARHLVAAIVLSFLACLNGCGCTHRTPIAPKNESPYDRIHLVALDGTATTGHTDAPLPANAYRWSWPWQRGLDAPSPPQPFLVLEPRLKQWMADSLSTKVDTYVVSFADPIRIPRFPDPVLTASWLDAVNLAARDSAAMIIAHVRSLRDSAYAADTLALATQFGATVLEHYWITQAVKIVMPLGLVDSLSHRPGVVYVQLDHTNSPPPGWDTNDGNDPVVVRTMIDSDHYYDHGFPYGAITLLDTGVRKTHMIFDPTNSPFQRLGDCVGGGPDCTGGDASDAATKGHGTPSAALLVGNSPAWPRFRGVTGAKLDAFRVYVKPANPANEPTLLVSAALRGFEAATSMLDRVVVAEMQDSSPAAAAIGDAADNAFESGATVIAANGDTGPWLLGGLANPARSRRTIGVGAWDIMNGAFDPTTSYGTTIDQRNKPDLLAPSSAETAGALSDQERKYHGSTSGATPFVAGGAALVHAWLTHWTGKADPGQICAQIILSGSKVGPFDDSGAEGAGLFKLPTNGWDYLGKVELTNTYRECTIPIPILWSDITHMQAAIWWPEELVLSGTTEVDTHNDIDIALIDPSGTEVASSKSIHSVFERCAAPVATSSGEWKFRITTKDLKRLPQTVYWTVACLR